MTDQPETILLEKCFAYALSNSKASNPSTAKVVELRDLERHVAASLPNLYYYVMNQHDSFLEFLKYTGRDVIRSGAIQSWWEWNYEVMNLVSYLNDKRHEHNCFSPLRQRPTNNANLFVLYLKEEKRRYESERARANRGIPVQTYLVPSVQLVSPTQDKGSQKPVEHDNAKGSSKPAPAVKRVQDLTEEINTLCQTLTPTQKIMDDVKNVKNRVQVMLNQVWPGRNYQVVLFGSSANSLALRDADVDLCILVPQESYEQDLMRYRSRLAKQPKSIYNMFFLAARLREMGMTQVEAIGGAQVPICKFVDPQTGYHCDINTNNVLGIENSDLIQEYCSLDTRIRPLIFAIKYFVKQKNINNPRGGTLSSYAYVIMILHFLMNAPGKPVIPSLQETPQRCLSRDCNFNHNRSVSLLQDNQIMKWNPRYHDCLYIDNVKTKKFEPHYRNNGTRWDGQNKDTVGILLRAFFRFYSDKDRFRLSIISASGAIQQPQHIQSTNSPFIIQDPFIRTKNVARSCTDAGARVILLEFERAAKMLSEGDHSFGDICKLPSNITRPVDTQSMEFRFRQKTVKFQPNQTNGTQVEITRQEDSYVGISYDETKCVARTLGFLDDSDEEEYIPVARIGAQRATPVNNTRSASNEVFIGHIEPDENITRSNELTIGVLELLTDDEQRELDLRAPSKSSSSSNQKPTDTTPILNLIKTLMEHKPKIGENTSVDTYTSKPCTDMSKLLESPAAKDVSAKDICYLIAQLNFLGDALAEKLTDSTRSTSNSVTNQQSSESESDYILGLQNMFNNLALEQSVKENQECDDECSIKRLRGKYNANDIITIEYYVLNPPDDLIEEYELYSIFQWYGKVKDVTLVETTVNSVWKITMDIRYGKLDLLPVEIDIGHDKLSAYAIIAVKATPQ